MNPKEQSKDKPLCRFCKPDMEVVQKLEELQRQKEQQKAKLPENPSKYEQTLIDKWQKEGSTDEEIAEWLRDFS